MPSGKKTEPDSVIIGFVERAHGVRGEVRVRPTTDNPFRFSELDEVILQKRSGGEEKFQIDDSVVRGERVYVRFKNVRTREAANDLRGSAITIPVEECLPLDEDEYYHFELVGLQVLTTQGRDLGTVERVWDLPANEVLVVSQEGAEHLIPFVKDVIKTVDIEEKQIIIEPIEGLLES